MSSNHQIVIIGSGSVSLYASWYLEQSSGIKVPIFSDRLVAKKIDRYRVCTNSIVYKFYPELHSMQHLGLRPDTLYVICETPIKSAETVCHLRAINPQSYILILSSYNPLFFSSKIRDDPRTLYAWPLISVETYSDFVSASNRLVIELTQSTVSKGFVDLLRSNQLIRSLKQFEEKHFISRTVLTYAIYSYMDKSNSIHSLFDQEKFALYCTNKTIQLANKLDLKCSNFPDLPSTGNLGTRLYHLFKLLPGSLARHQTSIFNALHLYSNKIKVRRFLSQCCFISET